MNIKKKTITIRFYEELNDFLPVNKRKIRFVCEFIDRTSVKDLIESIGVPHTEVDLILVNGKSVSFKYLIKDKDDISVYPAFESFDISKAQHLRSKPLRKPKFICDVHLGKLTRNLRMFGFDVYYKNNLSDMEIINISIADHRTILTRDLGILKWKRVTRGYYVRSTSPDMQTREVLTRFHLEKQTKPFSRCLECGYKLISVSKKKAINNLPEKVKQEQNKFYFCKNCNKIYWKGTHFNRMIASIKSILNLNKRNICG